LAYAIATNSDVQQKCYEEIIEACDGKTEMLDYDSVKNKLTYLDMVVQESLRMYPAAVRFDRMCKEDYNLNGIIIPRDSVIHVPVYAIHMDPENYPNPEKFIPERFTPEEKSKRDPILYLPFGFGPRNCIGMRIALFEMKMAIASLLAKFKILPTDTTPIPLKLSSEQLLRPTDPIKLNFVRRA